MDLKNLYKNVSFKKGDLIGIAKLPTAVEIAEFEKEKKRKKDAEMNRQISLDLNLDSLDTNLTTTVPKGQLISEQNCGVSQCAKTDLNKRFLPKPMTTTG